MRFALACVLAAAFIVPASAKDFRWTTGFGQGTTEAIIRNARGARKAMTSAADVHDGVEGM